MSAGRTFPRESGHFRDPLTGIKVRQVTTTRAIHHPPFYYIPAADDAMRHLTFISWRSGRPEVFLELEENGRLVQLTDRANIHAWSIHPSHDGQYVYFTAGRLALRVETHSAREEVLADFGSAAPGPVVARTGIGTTSVSRDDSWWAVPISCGDVARLMLLDLRSGRSECILERDTILHPQFHPTDPRWLRYSGNHDERLRVVRSDGTADRLIFQRDRRRKQWVVHETWLPGGFEIMAADWPHGVLAVDALTSAVRKVTDFAAWHPMVSRSGNLAVADTVHPDLGLQIFDPRDGVGRPRALCSSQASSLGEQWKADHCPYDDGPVIQPAPQHTHPHPSFTPDGRRVTFTSDRSGFAQVYVADLPPELSGSAGLS